MKHVTKSISSIIFDGCGIIGDLKKDRSSYLEVSRESEVFRTKSNMCNRKQRITKRKVGRSKKKATESHDKGRWV